jgi:hypothetical protein
MSVRIHWCAAAAFLLACRTTGTVPIPAPQQAARLAFEDVFVRGVGERDTAAVLRSLAPQLVLHIGIDTLVVPREQFGTVVHQITGPFPDISFSVDRVVAEGQWAAAGLTFHATHQGTWHGIAPTGRRVQVTETFICRLEERKLRECWQQWDEAGLREQLTRVH